MKYVKTLGLLAMTAIAAMAFAATATATELTSPSGTKYTGNISVESVGEVIFESGHAPYSCDESVAEGDIEQQGSTVTAKGAIDSWFFDQCGSSTVHILKKGTVELHTEKGESNGNGLITLSGSEVTAEGGGFHCIYATNNTPVGVLTGSNNTKGNAILDIQGTIPRVGGKSGIFCGSNSDVTAQYVVTKPSYLAVD